MRRCACISRRVLQLHSARGARAGESTRMLSSSLCVQASDSCSGDALHKRRKGSAVLAFADGASRGNPGHSGCGALLVHPVSGKVLATNTAYLGEQETNNSAEYNGLLLALRLAQEYEATEVHVHLDSQLIVRQMQGQYRVKAANLRELHKQCKELSASFTDVTFSHVPREENAAADQLANDAIDLRRR